MPDVFAIGGDDAQPSLETAVIQVGLASFPAWWGIGVMALFILLGGPVLVFVFSSSSYHDFLLPVGLKLQHAGLGWVDAMRLKRYRACRPSALVTYTAAKHGEFRIVQSECQSLQV